MTEWRAVTGFEGFYEISDDGQVRSIDRWILIRGNRTFLRGVPRKAFPKPRTGHLAVVLRREGQHYSRHVEREAVDDRYHREPVQHLSHL